MPGFKLNYKLLKNINPLSDSGEKNSPQMLSIYITINKTVLNHHIIYNSFTIHNNNDTMQLRSSFVIN